MGEMFTLTLLAPCNSIQTKVVSPYNHKSSSIHKQQPIHDIFPKSTNTDNFSIDLNDHTLSLLDIIAQTMMGFLIAASNSSDLLLRKETTELLSI
jgi:hypothetical protein